MPDGTEAEKDEPILNPDTNEPFNLLCYLNDGKILSVSSWFAFIKVFKDHDVQDGDTIVVKHPKKGEWIVEKIDKSIDKSDVKTEEDIPF
ncbi:MAG: hypothetical protein GF317_03385 [Candidatus Lokiarchaeota archaeon]|nr:hypothetical protein [Candidatus Lokiarchaeota archaeon]